MTSTVESNGLATNRKSQMYLVEQSEHRNERENGVVRFLSQKLRDWWTDAYIDARNRINSGISPTLQDTFVEDKERKGPLTEYADALAKTDLIPRILNKPYGIFTPGTIDEWVALYEKNVASPYQHVDDYPLSPQQRLNEEVRMAKVSVTTTLLTQLHQERRIAEVQEKLGLVAGK